MPLESSGAPRHSLAVLPATDPADWIESAARDQPHRLFLKTPTGRELSYASLHEESGRFAAALMGRGVLPGDRVAVQVEKSAEAVLLYVTYFPSLIPFLRLIQFRADSILLRHLFSQPTSIFRVNPPLVLQSSPYFLSSFEFRPQDLEDTLDSLLALMGM